MGNFSSQYLEEWANSTKNATEGSLIRKDDATDNLTPKNKDVRWLPWDPRSPSRAIKRTPIQVERTPPTIPKSKYAPVRTADFSSDENDDDLEGEEVTEEYNFECAAATINYKSAKTRYNNEVSVPVRSPLKLSAMRNIDSPVMLLRYKQIKGIQRKQLIRSAEMCHMARDDQN